ncbi:MAG: glycoside hydrolase family 2 [Prevotella sp.]|nr:glycoside hydrolase family 2 [Prevotella sp.]
MKQLFLFVAFGISSFAGFAQSSVETCRQYLSGHGCDDMVEWDFQCTGGRNAGQWTKIGVPSCWELQGFGTYQYGMSFYGKPTPEGIADEKGNYRYDFFLPNDWQGRQIELVFEAVMTDARVTINGRKAGSGQHQGGFYRFAFDVTDRVFFGKRKNHLEVEVSKESANSQVNMAERRADYWNFGGIIRPVFVVAKPPRNIERVAIDAGMDGRFRADCYLNRALDGGGSVKTEIVDAQGNIVASQVTGVRTSDHTAIDFKVKSPLLWTAETPNRYTAVFTLTDAKGKVMHREREKFGFRTIEYRASDGVYINGSKVIFKGVNRHSFRPESGRTLSKAKCIEDVLLIKSMNMNAVRLSHYPADPEFLDACDSLGLYVDDELSGWHWAHETIVGQKLVKEMVTRDVNHPSIVFWTNGNEGGFNYELEPEFARWDIQQRVVLYPWANRNGFETKHYRSYGETEEYMRQPEIFMPTEFLHGLYDGGHGAGLKDYWTMMMQNPRCAGGFLWDLADEGVVRTDKGGIIDCVGNYGADGIVGPHFEKEGSFYTIKQMWSPVQLDWGQQPLEPVGGTINLTVTNRYDFLNLKTCRLGYRYLQLPDVGKMAMQVLAQGTLVSPDVAPGQQTVVQLKNIPATANALELTVTDSKGQEVLVSSKEIKVKGEKNTEAEKGNAPALFSQSKEGTIVKAAGKSYMFDGRTGWLKGITIGGNTLSLSRGPRLVAARRSDRSFDQFYNHDDKEAEKKKTQYTLYEDHGAFDSFNWHDNDQTLVVKYRHGSLDSVTYHFLPMGDVEVKVDYNFSGVVDLMGIALDYPEAKVRSKAWVGDGPYRVWQNRLDGPQYGFWQNEYNDPIPGESWIYPEFKGYFANVSWMQLMTDEGTIAISDLHMAHPADHMAVETGDRPYVGIYQPRDGRDHLLYELPETGLSLLQVIPAVRNKVNTTDLNGPSAQPAWVTGTKSIRFRMKVGK